MSAKKIQTDKKEKSIDKVTACGLHLALQVFGIVLPIRTVDKIIDVVELLEVKGNETTLSDLYDLKEKLNPNYTAA